MVPGGVVRRFETYYCGKKVNAHGWASIYPGRKCVVKNRHSKVTWEGKMKKTCGTKSID